MAVEKKTDLIGGLGGKVPPTRYIRSRDPDTGVMQATGAVQYAWIKNVPGSDIVILEDAAEALDSSAEVGNPALDASLEIKSVQTIGMGADANGGKALARITWGRIDVPTPSGSRGAIPKAWGTKHKVPLVRYITAGASTIATSAGSSVQLQASGRPAEVVIEWPVYKFYYRETTTGATELGVFDDKEGQFNDGTWEGFATNVVQFLGHSLRSYVNGSTSIHDRIFEYEFRPFNEAGTDSGWYVHTVNNLNQLVVVDIRTHMGNVAPGSNTPFPNI